MARASNRFVCQSCGAVHGKWSGKCDSCDEWNSIVEETAEATVPKGVSRSGGKPVSFTTLDGAPENLVRRMTGMKELDRVCGGGLVPGSALLVGGDPGIGKSTLLLQAAAMLARTGVSVAYISGEEAIDQIRLRADRLGLSDAPVNLATATNIRDILAALDTAGAADVAIIDSVEHEATRKLTKNQMRNRRRREKRRQREAEQAAAAAAAAATAAAVAAADGGAAAAAGPKEG